MTVRKFRSLDGVGFVHVTPLHTKKLTLGAIELDDNDANEGRLAGQLASLPYSWREEYPPDAELEAKIQELRDTDKG